MTYAEKPKVKLEKLKFIKSGYLNGKYHPVQTPRIGYLLYKPVVGSSFLMADLDAEDTNKGMGTSTITDVWEETPGVVLFRTENSVYRMTYVEEGK